MRSTGANGDSVIGAKQLAIASMAQTIASLAPLTKLSIGAIDNC